MNTNRKTAIIVGVLYIVGTVTAILSVIATGPVLNDPDYLIKATTHEPQMLLGALLVLAMSLSLAMVPVMLFPILKQHNQVLAVGYVVFRGALETVTGIATVVTWLFLLVVSREYVAAGASEASNFQALGSLLLQGGNDAIAPIMGIVFSLGALMLYFVFYQSKLIPRWLSVWGFLAIILHLATCFLLLFHLQSLSSTANSVMNFPIFLQEMVMAVWLIVKGFSPAAIAGGATQVAKFAPAK